MSVAHSTIRQLANDGHAPTFYQRQCLFFEI